MSTLALRNVCKIYPGNNYAVKDFNLDIQDGEFIIFVGPSGCGKSTTLRMIAGLEEISKGELWMDGCLMNYVDARERELSMVFQSYALYPNMTVYGNLAYSLKIRKTPKHQIDKRVTEVAKMLEIDHLLNRYPDALSGGQKQRVAIGSAIVRNPKVFLMDEPLSNLDAKLRAQMRVRLGELHKQLKNTIIYVTHDQTEAMTLGSRIVIMKEGKVHQVDTPQNLYNHPVNKFVAGFIGSPSMNFLEVGVEYKFGDRYAEQYAQTLKVLAGRNPVNLHVTEEQKSRLRKNDYNRSSVIMGIRPEDVYTEEQTENSENTNAVFSDFITVKITAKELLGVETMLYFDLAGTQFCARVHPETKAEIGQEIRICFDMNKMHFFDAVTEQTLV